MSSTSPLACTPARHPLAAHPWGNASSAAIREGRSAAMSRDLLRRGERGLRPAGELRARMLLAGLRGGGAAVEAPSGGSAQRAVRVPEAAFARRAAKEAARGVARAAPVGVSGGEEAREVLDIAHRQSMLRRGAPSLEAKRPLAN